MKALLLVVAVGLLLAGTALAAGPWPPDQQDRQARYLELNPPVELPGPNATPDTDELYRQAAIVISKRPETTVKCHTTEEWHDLPRPSALGLTYISRAEIHLSPRACELLRARDYDGVLTLAHEAWHVTGIRDEATVNCYAQQTITVVAVALGAMEASARALQASGPPTDPRAPYYSAECRENGKLDLSPADGRWP